MLSISKSQLRVLAEDSIEAYLDRVTARIRADFPSELGTVSRDDLRLRVKAAFERFRSQGFQRKEYLHRLIVLELLFGPRFEVRLPPAALMFAFPPPREPYPSESERFWTIYKSAETLTYRDTLLSTPPTSALAGSRS